MSDLGKKTCTDCGKVPYKVYFLEVAFHQDKPFCYDCFTIREAKIIAARSEK